MDERTSTDESAGGETRRDGSVIDSTFSDFPLIPFAFVKEVRVFFKYSLNLPREIW